MASSKLVPALTSRLTPRNYRQVIKVTDHVTADHVTARFLYCSTVSLKFLTVTKNVKSDFHGYVLNFTNKEWIYLVGRFVIYC